jgi:hypothetical protein
VSVVLGVLIGAAALIAARLSRRRRLPARAVIVSPHKSTVVAHDGAVRSVQLADLTVTTGDLERLWNPKNLENLARTYWRFVSRATIGLVRVVYGKDERRVVLLARPLTLLRFGAPEYVLEPGHGRVSWRIRDGLLVARSGRGCGFLAIDVRPLAGDAGSERPQKLRIEVEVANFYPAIAAGFSMPVYQATQSWLHVVVTHAFLRSLATLDLAESKVRLLAIPDATPPATHATPDAPTPDPPATDSAPERVAHP